ncbi:hypothetical protein, partial [uncultured Ruegeria sp.]
EPPPAGGGDNPYAWFAEDISDEEKEYLDNKKFDNPRKVLKSLRAAEGMIRGDKISGPPDDPEKHANWLKESGLAKRLGVPENPEDYGIERPDFGEDTEGLIQYDDDRHNRVMGSLHEMNLTPAQVKGVLDLYAQETGNDARAFSQEAVHDEANMTSTLQRDWGNDYDQNLKAALEVGAESGLDEAKIEALRVGKVAGSLELTKILFELAEVRGNDTLKGGGRGGLESTSREQAQKELNDFQSRNAKALTQHDHPEHETAFAEFQRLKKRAGRGAVGRE